MSKSTAPQLQRPIQLAQRINKLLSWGMPPEERDSMLAEGLADWEAMSAELGARRIILRALRGIPSGVWARINSRDITAVPAGVAMSALGIGGVAAGAVGTAYPAPLRASIVLAGIGGLLLSLCLFTQPRRLVARRYVVPLVTMAAGFIGMAINVPSPSRWSDQRLAAGSASLDSALTFAFLMVGAGLLLMALLPATSEKRRLARISGLTVVVGMASFAVTQVLWGLTVAPHDLSITIPSIGAGLAAGSAAHVVPRLRHLEIL